MKIEQSIIDQISTAFQKMQSKEDLLHLLNVAKPLVYGEKAVPFQLKQLTWYSSPKLAKDSYTTFKVKKKSGAERTIHAPKSGLKSIQKTLSFVLQCVFEPHKAATGFVREKSIVDNAKVHVGNKYVYNIDLKDFFPSIDQARVWKCLQLKPFNLNDNGLNNKEKKISSVITIEEFIKEHKPTKIQFIKSDKGNFMHFIKTEDGIEKYISIKLDKTISLKETNVLDILSEIKSKCVILVYKIGNNTYLKFRIKDDVRNVEKSIVLSKQKIANVIASLCCAEMEVERLDKISGKWNLEKRNVLPQGAPTSPILTNVICQRMDYLLSAVAKRFGLNYTRYADDMTFSSMHNVYQNDSEFLKELHRIIAEQGFYIKESKTRLQKEGYRQEVTGLLVNENVNVQKRYIKQLRMWLYYWETYGYERAYTFFMQQYIADKTVLKGKPNMANVIDGKLNYLKMVKGAENNLYLKLRGRFEVLNPKEYIGNKKATLVKTSIIETKNNVKSQNYSKTIVDLIFEVGLDNAMTNYEI